MSHDRLGTGLSRRAYLSLGVAAAGALGVGTAPATAREDPAPTDAEAGGGAGYDRTVDPDDADVIVSTRGQLLDALEEGSKTIYVDDDATIDLSARRITIPGDVTLASGRGRNGSSGALITADERASRLFEVFEEGVRITGLRFRGHRVGYYDPPGRVWSHNSLAIRAYTDCEIDNCELYGWTHAAVGIGRHGSDPLSSAAHVHHCSIHDNMMSGLGYGVVVYRGEPLIEHNYFDANRHSIAGGGRPGCSYEARYNLQGPNGLIFGFEMHSPGGDRIDVHHNTFELVENRGGDTTAAVAVRGTPSDGARVANNWFHNPVDPGDDRYLDDAPVVQYGGDVTGDGWDDVALSNNHYGPDEPEPGIGHPRGEPETAQLRVYVRETGVDEYLEGATVSIEPRDVRWMGSYDGSYEVETEPGEEYFGTYARFDALPIGVYDVRAAHPEYEATVETDLELDPSGRQPSISLEPREDDVLTVVGRGEVAYYEFSVSGDVERSTEYGGTIDDYVTVEGSTVSGRTVCGCGRDSFAFTGEIESFEADAPVDLLLNGEEVDPDDLVGEDPTDPIDDGQVITLEGGSESDPTHYLIEAGERLEYADADDATVDPEDAIVGTMAAGALRGGRDAYRIPADDAITGFIALGDVTVTVDGTELASDEVVPYFD